ncbi:MAG: hypothetical protein K5922_04185 [Clostridiales bacterium]|nr:hypothetical protein [Clostridiales bacterium]
MKNQRFRFKLIALLLIGLIGLAGVYGIRTIPLTGPSVSLRDAILRLTGQSSPAPSVSPPPEAASVPPPPVSASPEPEAKVSPAPGGTEAKPASTFGSPDPQADPSTEGLGVQVPVSETSAYTTPDEFLPPTAASVPPLSEALSNYFENHD